MREARRHSACGGLTCDRARVGGYIALWSRPRNVYAHRVVWEAYHGPIPEGLAVCHTCDQRDCYDIRHLFVGTIADNNRDRDQKGRGAIPDNRGTRHGMHKLTDEQVIAIYRSTEPGRLLASRYGVAPSAITKIRRGYSWKHLTGKLSS
jgi:hypothetical protein